MLTTCQNSARGWGSSYEGAATPWELPLQSQAAWVVLGGKANTGQIIT